MGTMKRGGPGRPAPAPPPSRRGFARTARPPSRRAPRRTASGREHAHPTRGSFSTLRSLSAGISSPVSGFDMVLSLGYDVEAVRVYGPERSIVIERIILSSSGTSTPTSTMNASPCSEAGVSCPASSG